MMSSVTSPSVENIPRHRDHRSGDHDLTDHDRSESLITILRNPQQIQEKWGKLTDQDLTVINGKKEQLIGKIQVPRPRIFLDTEL